MLTIICLFRTFFLPSQAAGWCLVRQTTTVCQSCEKKRGICITIRLFKKFPFLASLFKKKFIFGSYWWLVSCLTSARNWWARLGSLLAHKVFVLFKASFLFGVGTVVEKLFKSLISSHVCFLKICLILKHFASVVYTSSHLSRRLEHPLVPNQTWLNSWPQQTKLQWTKAPFLLPFNSLIETLDSWASFQTLFLK